MIFYIYNHIHLQYCIATLLFLLTFISHITLLKTCYRAVKYDRFSSSVLINLILWCTEAGISAAYLGQAAVLFDAKKSGYMVFWLSVGYLSVNAAVSTSVAFLLIDRIFALSKATQYYKHRQRFTWITIFGFSIVGLLNFCFYFWAEWSIADVITECYSLSCAAKYKYTIQIGLGIRLIIGFLNGILALILEIILCRHAKRSSTSQKQFKRANFLTIILAVTELFFIFLPNLIFVVCTYLGIDHWTKIGPYSVDMHAISALLTATIYRYVINSSVSNINTHNPQSGPQTIRTTMVNSSTFVI